MTTPRRHGNQKGQPCPCPDTGHRGRDWPLSETLQPATQSHKNTSTPKTGSERMPDRQRDQGCFHPGDQPSSWPIPAPGRQGGLQPAATSYAHSGPSPPCHPPCASLERGRNSLQSDLKSGAITTPVPHGMCSREGVGSEYETPGYPMPGGAGWEGTERPVPPPPPTAWDSRAQCRQ